MFFPPPLRPEPVTSHALELLNLPTPFLYLPPAEVTVHRAHPTQAIPTVQQQLTSEQDRMARLADHADGGPALHCGGGAIVTVVVDRSHHNARLHLDSPSLGEDAASPTVEQRIIVHQTYGVACGSQGRGSRLQQ